MGDSFVYLQGSIQSFKSEIDREEEKSATHLEMILSDADLFPNLGDSHSQFMK